MRVTRIGQTIQRENKVTALSEEKQKRSCKSEGHMYRSPRYETTLQSKLGGVYTRLILGHLMGKDGVMVTNPRYFACTPTYTYRNADTAIEGHPSF